MYFHGVDKKLSVYRNKKYLPVYNCYSFVSILCLSDATQHNIISIEKRTQSLVRTEAIGHS
jgi:hypothetical protein